MFYFFRNCYQIKKIVTPDILIFIRILLFMKDLFIN